MHLSLAYEIERYLKLCSCLPGIRQTLDKHFLHPDQLKPLYHLLKSSAPTVNGESLVHTDCFKHPRALDFVLSYFDGHTFRVGLFDAQTSTNIVTSYLAHYFEKGDTENLMKENSAETGPGLL